MAKIIYSGTMITEASGKFSGSILSRNRGGNYAKDFAIPSNPQSFWQTAVRSTMADAVFKWQGLSLDQQSEWSNAAAHARGSSSRLGSSKLSGYNYFVRCNFVNFLCDGTGLTSPPIPAPVPVIERLRIVDLDPLLFNISVELIGIGSIVPADCSVIIFATNSLSNGITSRKNGYTPIVQLFGGDDMSLVDIFSYYLLAYPAPVLNKAIFVRARVYSKLQGNYCPFAYARGYVA